MTRVVSQSITDDAKDNFTAAGPTDAQLRKIIDTIPVLAWCNLPDGSNEFLNQRSQKINLAGRDLVEFGDY